MKSIMISIKPKWCAKIMNGEKTIEVRKNKALANAIKKLIYKYGYADIYVYCNKGKPYLHYGYNKYGREVLCDKEKMFGNSPLLNGEVLFKFRCYKVEEIKPLKHKASLFCPYDWLYYIVNNSPNNLKENSCLGFDELHTYLQGKNGYAIHIRKLEIFDKPKRLFGFSRYVERGKCKYCSIDEKEIREENCPFCHFPIIEAPQNFCYIEGDNYYEIN